MKQITIKFTKSKGWFPAIMMKLFKHKYTHTALSLDGEVFTSFTEDGFIKESRKYIMLKNYKPKYVYHQLDVEDHIHEAIFKEIEYLKQQNISYSHCMALCAFLKFPLPIKNRYTCSCFVADMLKKHNAFPLKRKASTYLPNDLFNELKSCRQIFNNSLSTN